MSCNARTFSAKACTAERLDKPMSHKKFKTFLDNLVADEKEIIKKEYIQLEAMYKREQRNGK